MKLKEIKISVHRKYTKNYNSFGYRIGLMVDCKGENYEDVHSEMSEMLYKLMLIENRKIDDEMLGVIPEVEGYEESERAERKTLDESGVCISCGVDTIRPEHKYCPKCYYRS